MRVPFGMLSSIQLQTRRRSANAVRGAHAALTDSRKLKRRSALNARLL